MKKVFLLAFLSLLSLFLMLPKETVFAQEPLELNLSASSNLDELRLEDLPSAKILPDSPFYFLKTLKEKLQLFLTPSAAEQAELLLGFAQKRLAEALAVYGKGKAVIGDRLLGLSLHDLKTAQEKIIKAKSEGQEVYGILQKLNETADYQKLTVGKLKEGTAEVNDLLLQIDQRLVVREPTESAKIRPVEPAVEHPPNRLQKLWQKFFGSKEILRPLVD